MTAEPLLAVEGLRTWFELRRWGFARAGEVRAVDGVDFTLARGEAIAVVGESGCGKSTLAKTLLGLHRPRAGRVVFDGRPLNELDGPGRRWFRAQLGYVQQDPYGALPPFMTARRILEEPLIIHGVKDRAKRRERVRAALDEVRLSPVEDFLEKFPHQLSGGQQQRLVIARAIVLGPQLIVADEPVSMLDASVRVEILKLLRGLQRERGLAVLYITHDLSTVRYFCERIFVMYAGKLIEKGEVDALLDRPLHPYTRALLAAIPDPDPANAHTHKHVPPGEPPSLLSPPPGCRFHPRCAEAIAGKCDRLAPPEFQPGAVPHAAACFLHEP